MQKVTDKKKPVNKIDMTKDAMKEGERMAMEIADRGDSTNKQALNEMVERGIKYNTAKTILWTAKTQKYNKLPRRLTLKDGILTFLDKA